MFDFARSPLPVHDERAEAFRHVWRRLAAPGTWWTGEERVSIAAVARAAYESGESTEESDLLPAATEALHSSTPSLTVTVPVGVPPVDVTV